MMKTVIEILVAKVPAQRQRATTILLATALLSLCGYYVTRVWAAEIVWRATVDKSLAAAAAHATWGQARNSEVTGTLDRLELEVRDMRRDQLRFYHDMYRLQLGDARRARAVRDTLESLELQSPVPGKRPAEKEQEP